MARWNLRLCVCCGKMWTDTRTVLTDDRGDCFVRYEFTTADPIPEEIGSESATIVVCGACMAAGRHKEV